MKSVPHGGSGWAIRLLIVDWLISASSASWTTSDRRGRPYVTRLHRWCGPRKCRSLRDYPKLHAVFFAKATVNNNDSRLINTAPGHQVIASACSQQAGLADATGSAAISNDVSLRCRIVLQLDGQVIQTGFLIVKRTPAANVKLS